MLCRMIGSSVRSEAASKGSAAFLLPAGVNSPSNGTPPSIMNLSMFISWGTAAYGVRDCKAVYGLRQDKLSRALARQGRCAPATSRTLASSASTLLTIDLHDVTKEEAQLL